MEKWFDFKGRGTNASTEVIAGITTFITMVYIAIVNPAILSKTGMDFNGVFVATILATMIGTLIMGVFSNYPIAIAPGMGLNSFFAFAVVLALGITWQKALGAVFIASLIFLVLSFTKFRNVLINSIPESLKHSITAGIGLFIAFIGLQGSKIIVDSPATLVTFGHASDPVVLLTIFNLFVTVVLMMFNVRGNIFIGMVITAIIALFNGMITLPPSLFVWPTGLEHTAMQMDIKGVFDDNLYAIIFTFFLITLFDTTGTMIGIAEQAGLIKDGKFPRIKSALLADAVGSTAGAMLGTSPTSAYIESGAGVAVGGRTGFSSVVVALLFGL